MKQIGILVCLFLLLGCAPAAVAFRGDDLGKVPAPGFSLQTSDGQQVSLSDARGQVVVLTFVYTRCTDICPLIAHKLNSVYSGLGDDAARVRFIAVSTAPETDTPISIARFSQEQGMTGKWLFLTGSREQLEPVWKSYFIDVAPAVESDGTAFHQSRVIVIDAQGNERVNHMPDFRPKDLEDDLKNLLAH